MASHQIQNPQGTQRRLKRQINPPLRLVFAIKLFMMRRLLNSNFSRALSFCFSRCSSLQINLFSRSAVLLFLLLLVSIISSLFSCSFLLFHPFFVTNIWPVCSCSQSLSFTLLIGRPLLSRVLSLSFSSFHVRRHIQRIHKLASFKIPVVVLKSSCPCNFPPNNAGCRCKRMFWLIPRNSKISMFS